MSKRNLFPQGHSKVLNRTEDWLLLKELYKVSHYKSVESGEPISKMEWETQVAPAGGPVALWDS